jgi:hypothetical protein
MEHGEMSREGCEEGEVITFVKVERVKAPSSNIQAPEKLQIPSFNVVNDTTKMPDLRCSGRSRNLKAQSEIRVPSVATEKIETI